MELLREKIKENFEVGSSACVTMGELAEKIDKLVNKIINLEASVSSQTALIQRLRLETNELQAEIQTLEEDKEILFNGKNDLREQLREMEEKLYGLQDLNQSVEYQNNNLEAHFTEARSNIDHLSERLLSVKSDEEFEFKPETGDRSLVKVESQEAALNPDDSLEKHQNVKTKEMHELKVGKSHEDFKGSEDALNPVEGLGVQQNLKPRHELKVSYSSEKVKEYPAESSFFAELKEQEDKMNDADSSIKTAGIEREDEEIKEHGQNSSQPKKTIDLNNSLEELSGLEIEEKTAKKDSPSPMDDLNVEIWKQETMLVDEPDWKQLFMNVQVRELKGANAKKDEQIQFLRQKLILLQAGLGEDSKPVESMVTEQEVTGDINVILIDQPETTSEIEDRFRMNIDEVLEENLNFWLREYLIENMTIIVDNYVESLKSKYPYWNRTLGADHFFVTCHDVGVRATEGVPFLIKNAIRVVCSPSYDDNSWFWAGHRNSRIRVILARVWENDTELDISNNRINRATGHLVYQKRFYGSKYCICPGGSQVNSARIADSIHYGCIPVILSNYYDLPFNDILDWHKFSVILKEQDVYRLKQILKDIPDNKFVSLHKNLVKVQKHFQWNSPPVKYDAFHMVMYDLWLRRHVIKY
ncbi:hypothetical protein NC652_013947 [Populus alba x Populus x berolinensis]|nr:hypothetical protein NC652_013947 [Populus alba x Populus x berolinensis]